jgi:hypothetical protein
MKLGAEKRKIKQDHVRPKTKKIRKADKLQKLPEKVVIVSYNIV